MQLRALTALALAAAVAGCASHPEGKGPATGGSYKPAPADPWILNCIDPAVSEPALLWNGLIGVRINRDGTGARENGFFSIDEYETTGEEKIRSLWNPLTMNLTVATEPAQISPASGYQQTLDMRTGVLSTRYRTAKGIVVQSDAVLDTHEPVLAQRWRLQGPAGTPFSVIFRPSDAPKPVQKSYDPSRWTLSPSGKRMTIAYDMHAGPAEWISQRDVVRLDGQLGADGNASFEQVIAFGISPNAAAMRRAAGLTESPPDTTRRLGSYDAVAASSAAAWAQRWKTDIIIDGPIEDQQAVRSFLFYLRSSIHPEGRMGVSPFALSNPLYKGHVFWDADTWVFPALALIDPAAASAISRYRLDRAAKAEENFRAANIHAPGLVRALKFPWESSVTGGETAPPPFSSEIHITGSVLHSLRLSEALGLLPAGRTDPLLRAADSFYQARSELKSGVREIRNVVSVDELHHGDNDLYTNLLAQWLANRGTWKAPSQWVQYKIPRHERTLITYDGDALRSYKQAAALLSIYPLQYPAAEAQGSAMMERFADKVIANGPAMSDSVNAVIWARLGLPEKGYREWKQSWEEFVKQPHLLFSEKRHKPITYFTTGAAGCLQSVVYGFLGFRIDWKPQEGAQWSKPLALDQILSVKPNLPEAWKSVKFQNFTVLGRRYTLIATHKGVHVIQGDR